MWSSRELERKSEEKSTLHSSLHYRPTQAINTDNQAEKSKLGKAPADVSDSQIQRTSSLAHFCSELLLSLVFKI